MPWAAAGNRGVATAGVLMAGAAAGRAATKTDILLPSPAQGSDVLGAPS